MIISNLCKVIWMKLIRFVNATAVWNWKYKLILHNILYETCFISFFMQSNTIFKKRNIRPTFFNQNSWIKPFTCKTDFILKLYFPILTFLSHFPLIIDWCFTPAISCLWAQFSDTFIKVAEVNESETQYQKSKWFQKEVVLYNF